MSNTERLEAKGLRGEACIIVRTWTRLDTSNLSGGSDVGALSSHRLATGSVALWIYAPFLHPPSPRSGRSCTTASGRVCEYVAPPGSRPSN